MKRHGDDRATAVFAYGRARRPPLHILILAIPICLFLSCSRRPDRDTLVMIIEFSPTNLDPRVGLDAQSERIDGLLFDNLLSRDEHLSVKPGLADRWEIPDPKTYIFHLHPGVKFCDGRPLTSRDVSGRPSQNFTPECK